MSLERYKVQIAVTFLARSHSRALLTDYVTPFGVFIRTDSPPPAMNLLRIEFALPHDFGSVIMHGTVTRVVLPETQRGVPGVEISFFAKSGESGATWDEFIQCVRDMYPFALQESVLLAEGALDQTRRAHRRAALATPITIEPIGSEIASVTDISPGGMFIRTQECFAVGSELSVALVDPRLGARFTLDCIVRRRTFGSAGGIGVEFRNMDDGRRAALRTFLAVAGRTEAVEVFCDEVFAPPTATRKMTTLVGVGAAGVRLDAHEDSWARLDEYRVPSFPSSPADAE